MVILSKKEPFLLLIGDILVFILSLWISLLLRSGALPDVVFFNTLLAPFSILFAVWTLIYFIAGLYEKQTALFRKHLPFRLLNAQIINIVIAVFFFYFIQYFGITPKTILFIYLFVSFFLLLFWRFFSGYIFRSTKNEQAILIGTGSEVEKLSDEIKNNPKYGFSITDIFGTEEMTEDRIQEIIGIIKSKNISLVILDITNEKLSSLIPRLYNLIFRGVRVVDINRLYEDIFDSVPVTLVHYYWFLQNISLDQHLVYDLLKRIMDISLSVILGIIPLISYPFVWCAIKLDDGGNILISQKRIGQRGKVFTVYKFRSMQLNEDGVWITESENKITRIGSFLRKTRIDEFPQLWNVFKGDLSLIGPRPDISGLGTRLSDEIPYYMMRYIVKPGLSGWAQIHQDVAHSIEETKLRLSYDLYYVKNRSFILDLKIALKTIKTLIMRVGR